MKENAASTVSIGQYQVPVLVIAAALGLLALVLISPKSGQEGEGGKSLRKELRKDLRKERRRQQRKDRRADRRQTRRDQRRAGSVPLGASALWMGAPWSDDRNRRRTAGSADGVLVRLMAGLFGMLGRFLTGREVSGSPASNAGWFRAGSRPLRHALRSLPPPLESGSVGLPESRNLPAVPERPSAAVERWREWSAEHQPANPVVGGAVRRGGAVAVWVGTSAALALRGVGSIGRGLRTWGTWPYASRAAARLMVVAVAVGLWRDRAATELAAAALVGLVLIVAATGPAGLGWWRGFAKGDDRIYGPALWATVRLVLGQPDEEYLENWMSIPADVRADGAQVRLALPVEFAGTEPQQAELDHLVNTRLPGEWVSRWHMMGGQHYALWTHKPKPKAKKTPPDSVAFSDPRIQEAIRSAPLGHIVLGIDEDDRVVTRRLDGETAHWVASIGSGGGKSTLLQFIIAQLVVQFATVVGLDPKEISIKCFVDVPGIYIYNDPRNVQDMRRAVSWVKAELDARNYVAARKEVTFPKIVLVAEEANEFASLSKAYHDDTKEKGELASDPVWKDVASFMRLGRQNQGNMIAVFQELRDDILGGRGVKGLFRLFLMGSFFADGWKRVMGPGSVPECEFKGGRLLLVNGSERIWLQVPYATEDEYRRFALDEREAQGWTPERAGLFGTPPERSPERLPRLLRGTGHVTQDEVPEGASTAALGDESAGDSVTQGRRDATRDAVPGGQRDARREVADDGSLAAAVLHLRLAQTAADGATTSRRSDATDDIPGGSSDPIPEAVELLSFAEISRRLEARGIDIAAERMRQAKARDKRTGKGLFPKGSEVKGKNGKVSTLYTETEILEFFSIDDSGASAE